jgi:hypothetical protein
LAMLTAMRRTSAAREEFRRAGILSPDVGHCDA